MAKSINGPVSPAKWQVIVAFATVYIVWGSTYFFIRIALHGFPPLLLGAVRFLSAGLITLTWCVFKGEKIFIKQSIFVAAIVGTLLLVGGNGIVIWVEQFLPSAMVAIMVSSAPIWFVLLDKSNWSINLKNRSTVAGLIVGFAGVILLFGEELVAVFAGSSVHSLLPWMLLLVLGSIAWSAGSLYAKHHPAKGSAMVNVSWQMIIAGFIFLPASIFSKEFNQLQWAHIPLDSWLALGYLVAFGSIAAFSAYVWLLQVRPATQVSTYAYVNPVIAVVLGLLFAHERISLIQITGLVVILGSVLLINLAKYRKEKQETVADANSVTGKQAIEV